MNRKIRTPADLHGYQQKAVNHQCTHAESMMWLDMGLGKTAVTLTSIAHLLSTGFLRGVIIVAPIRVIRMVWRQEAVKWQHTQHLTFSLVTGTRDQRCRALMRKADVYLINYENLKWLAEAIETYFVKKNIPLPFNGLVWDEISKMKNASTNRVKAFKRVLPSFDWRTGLTGTPASNGYKDLHGQFLVVDGGKRLGESKQAFQSAYFSKDGPFKLNPHADIEHAIKTRIADITLEMSAVDYNPLPDMVVNDIGIELGDDLMSRYNALEREMFLRLDSGTEIEVFNAAALTNKCLQFAAGQMYPIPGLPMWERVHDAKLEALTDLIDELQGQPLLMAYAFRSDAERIMQEFKHLDPINLTDCKSQASLDNAMSRWRAGTAPLMIGHPASMGHGLDGLQEHGHNVAWYGLTWSLDLYDQFNARIRRQGQGVPVICHRLLAVETLDYAQSLALQDKASTQTSLRRAVNDYRKLKGI